LNQDLRKYSVQTPMAIDRIKMLIRHWPRYAKTEGNMTG